MFFLPESESKRMRLMPVDFSNQNSPLVFRNADEVWEDLGATIDSINPRALGLLLPFVSQLHWYAYSEARKRSCIVGLALPSNTLALVGLMEELPIEMIVATEEAAQNFSSHLKASGGLERIRAWFLIKDELAGGTDTLPKARIVLGPLV